MKLIIVLKRELKTATIPIPSVQDLQNSIPEMSIVSNTRNVYVVEIPVEKVASLKEMASKYYHVEEPSPRFPAE